MEQRDGDKKTGGEAGRGSRGQQSSSPAASSRSSSRSSSQATLVSQPPATHSMDLAAFTGGYDMRAHLRQILTFSDDDEAGGSWEDDEVSLESYDEADDSQLDEELQRLMAPQTHTPKPTDQAHAQALVPITEEGDVDSEEEREIMAEIRAEITNNVRQEMKSELDLYKAKMDTLKTPTGSGAGGKEGEKTAEQHSDLDDLEPKLRAAIIKMRKLDKILVKRVHREKQVKRDRILLERRLRREIEGLREDGKEEYKEVKTNEQKFLALELPPRHNEETSVDTYDWQIMAALPVVHKSDYREHEMQDVSRTSQMETNNIDHSCSEFRTFNVDTDGTRLPTACDTNFTHKSSKYAISTLPQAAGETHLKAASTGNVGNRPPSARLFTDCDVVHKVGDAGSRHTCESHGVAHVACDVDELPMCGPVCEVLPDLTAVQAGGAAWCWAGSTHATGVTVPNEFTGEEVFATQLNEDEYPGLHTRGQTKKGPGSSGGSDVGEGDSQTDDGHSHAGSSSAASGSLHGRKHRRGKDFIKRNKQLAADAGNVIAMTEEEKQRLDGLLLDVEAIPDIPDAPGMLDDSNPFQIAVKPGEGFVPEGDELRTLTSIDSRLKDLMPPEDYESIASSSMSHAPKHKLFTHTGVKHGDDWQRRGDTALFQNAEQREMNDRMVVIETELAKLKNPDEAEVETGVLGEEELHDLIEQCVTSLSRSSMSRLTLDSDSRTSFLDTDSLASHATTIDTTPRSPGSARQELLENPPRLPPDVLQKLLSEAYQPLSKQLSTLREDDHEDEDSSPVPADVWKLIAMEKVGQNGGPEDTTHVNNDPISARNGFRSFSRTSTSSSLASVSDMGRESRESQVVKLPEIDPSGTLITQGHYNQQSGSNQRPDSSNSVRSQWCVSNQHPDSSNFNVNHHSVNPVRHSDSSNSAWTPVNNVGISVSDSRLSDSYSDSRLEIMSLDGDLMSPHPPPPKQKREASSGGKSRTVTPASRTNVT